MVGSSRQLYSLLDIIERAPADLFWPAMLSLWSGCDDTWSDRITLLRFLRANIRLLKPHPFMDRAHQEAFAALPEQVQVFRGCSLRRIRGVSWTTERDIAEGFARGHRGIPVPDAVVASPVAHKHAIFAFFTDREESDVLLDPRRLRQLTYIPYVETGRGPLDNVRVAPEHDAPR